MSSPTSGHICQALCVHGRDRIIKIDNKKALRDRYNTKTKTVPQFWSKNEIVCQKEATTETDISNYTLEPWKTFMPWPYYIFDLIYIWFKSIKKGQHQQKKNFQIILKTFHFRMHGQII